MPIVNILTVIDTAKLLSDKASQIPNSSFDNPISLSNGATYLYMVGDSRYVEGQNANSELTVRLHSEDVIRWRFFAIDHGQTVSPVVVQFETAYNGAGVNPADYFSPDPPGLVLSTINVYDSPNAQQLDGQPVKENIHDNYFETTAIRAPSQDTTIWYQWKFKLIDQNGNVQGYYDWDPAIIVAA